MSSGTFVFVSPQSEIRITVIAADRDQATRELEQRINQLEQMGILITTNDFKLVNAF